MEYDCMCQYPSSPPGRKPRCSSRSRAPVAWWPRNQKEPPCAGAYGNTCRAPSAQQALRGSITLPTQSTIHGDSHMSVKPLIPIVLAVLLALSPAVVAADVLVFCLDTSGSMQKQGRF